MLLESNIEIVMKDFNVDREEAKKIIIETMEDVAKKQEESMYEVYEDIIRSSH